MVVNYTTHSIAAGIVFLIAIFLMGRYIKTTADKDKLSKKQAKNFARTSIFIWICAALSTKAVFLIQYLLVGYGYITTQKLLDYMSNLGTLNLIMNINFGFMTLLPGFVIGSLLLVWYFKKHRYEIGSYLDYWVIGTVLFMFVYRIRCFLQGCCYGLTTNAFWGISYDGALRSVAEVLTPFARHPAAIYESMGFLVLFVVLYEFNRRKSYNGQTSLLFLVLYPLIRIAVEFFRWKPFRIILKERIGEQVYYFSITFTQIACFVMFLTGLSLLVYIHYKGKKK